MRLRWVRRLGMIEASARIGAQDVQASIVGQITAGGMSYFWSVRAGNREASGTAQSLVDAIDSVESFLDTTRASLQDHDHGKE